MIRASIATARMARMGQTNGGLIYLLPEIIVRLTYLIPLLFLWHTLAESGAAVEMNRGQMLSYTLVNALLADMMVVRTFATSWCYEGELQKLYIRPMSVYGGIMAETVGGWLPMLLAFSLPLACLAPLFGISLAPATSWFFPSLLMCISLGFAIDLMFACLAIELRGISWLAHVIRMAITALLSGTFIPFRILPFGLTRFFELQPFGSLGGAPLSLFVGSAEPGRILLTQLVWNMLLWIVANRWFKKAQERMVSFGG